MECPDVRQFLEAVALDTPASGYVTEAESAASVHHLRLKTGRAESESQGHGLGSIDRVTSRAGAPCQRKCLTGDPCSKMSPATVEVEPGVWRVTFRLRIQELAIDDWSRAAQALSDARTIRAVPLVGSIRV